MTREEVLRLARESDFVKITHDIGSDGYTVIRSTFDADYLEAFADLVAAHEREECAKVCDDADARFMRRAEGRLMTDAGADAYRSASSGALQCALAIRARGKA